MESFASSEEDPVPAPLSASARAALIARAVIAVITGLVVTFVPLHSPVFGLATLGAYTLLGGLVVIVWTRRHLEASTGHYYLLGTGLLNVIAGVASLALIPSADPSLLRWMLAGWGVLSGALEAYAGLRCDAENPLRKELLIVGVLTLLVGASYLVQRVDPVLQVGVFGLLCIAVGVLLGIAALSPKEGHQNPARMTGTHS